MNLFNRLVVIALALAMVAGGAYVMAATLRWISPSMMAGTAPLRTLAATLVALDVKEQVGYSLGGAVSLVTGVILLLLEAPRGSRTRELIIQRDTSGKVAVSLAGLRRLAEHVVGDIPGVERVVTLVAPGRRGLTFHCRVQVIPEINTSQLAEEIRARLSAAVTQHINQPVSQIHVHTQVGSAGSMKRRLQ